MSFIHHSITIGLFSITPNNIFSLFVNLIRDLTLSWSDYQLISDKLIYWQLWLLLLYYLKVILCTLFFMKFRTILFRLHINYIDICNVKSNKFLYTENSIKLLQMYPKSGSFNIKNLQYLSLVPFSTTTLTSMPCITDT